MTLEINKPREPKENFEEFWHSYAKLTYSCARKTAYGCKLVTAIIAEYPFYKDQR